MVNAMEDMLITGKTEEWLTARMRSLANQGYAGAQYTIGLMYAESRGVPQDFVEAAKWFRLAAEQGYAKAQCYLGWMYFVGQGVLEDDADAVKWYRLAAKQGLAAAQYNLGKMYDNGLGVPRDDVEAVKWYRLAAEQGQQRDADYEAKIYSAQALSQLRSLANRGFAEAQFNLGWMYANGEGVPRDDAEAAKWYRRAAKLGHRQAIYNQKATILSLYSYLNQYVPDNDGECNENQKASSAKADS